MSDRVEGSERANKAWCWSGRDPSSLSDIVMVVALGSRKQVQAASVRLGLPKPKKLQPMKAGQPGYDSAISEPGHVFWMDEDDFLISPRPSWRRESDLELLRREATTRRKARGGVPIHRPD